MDILNEWLKKHRRIYIDAFEKECDSVTERIVCRDGYGFYCQANESVHCNPRKSNAFPYSSVELGYPTEKDNLINTYGKLQADCDVIMSGGEKRIECIYPYVPVKTVIKLIKKHGGFKDGPSKADIDILEAGYKLIEPGVDNHLTYFKHINDHKIRVIDINKKDYKITCYNKHVLGSSRVAIMTKAEKRLFTAKLEEIGV